MNFHGAATFGQPWVPETFLARFPVSVKSLVASAYGRRCVGLRPNTENSRRTREKPLVPRVPLGGVPASGRFKKVDSSIEVRQKFV